MLLKTFRPKAFPTSTSRSFALQYQRNLVDLLFKEDTPIMSSTLNVNTYVKDRMSLPFTSQAQEVGGGESNESCRFDEEFKYILLPVSYSLVCFVGVILNSVAMWMFISKMRPWKTSTVFMFHLALSDTLYVLSLPTLVYYYGNRSHWPFGVVLCKLVRFMFYANLYSSILFLTCISIHRYLGVCHPIRSLTMMKKLRAHLVCGVVWLAVTVCLVPYLIFVNTSERDGKILCHDTTRPENFEEFVDYSSVIMCLLFGVPFVTIMLCYCLMARELYRRRHGISSNRKRTSSHRRSIKLIIVVLVVFAVSFVPFHITRTLYYTYRVLEAECEFLNVINFTYKVTRPLASVNSCIDPILYFLAGDHYRSKLVRLLTKQTQSRPQSPSSTELQQQRKQECPSICNRERSVKFDVPENPSQMS